MAPKYVDMRSDTFSKPSQAMREAMANADVGETMVLALEAKCAKIFGKEKALLVPTGTMGNLLSVMAHCQERGLEVIMGDKSHIYLFEQGHVAQLYNLAQENDIKVHVDGARILNASVGLGVPVSDITKFCDSVTCCLNKGIGAPFGSIVAGTGSFIKKVERSRKALGGEMHQLGMEAAAALYGLDRFEESIQKDHFLANKLVNGLKNLSSSVVTVEPDEVQTNLVLIKIDKEMSSIINLKERLMTTTEAEVKELGKEIHVGCKLLGKDIRFAICCNINEEDIDDAIKKVCYVFNEIHF
ncbi:uncharacterized protein LOC106874140 isoform X6 [Octopus bimaculoides]|uniref:uncharacterized protein LOC106874140 isoform X6 n=1 Tax=Octopus bimaculoides TaxID=37653 RepID=UPI0022E3BB9D|nr:uncharacterized protein LOC106874140 isoform X6 [Octopus bimaculoides]